MSEEVMLPRAFIVWYSGMEVEKVMNAYRRWLKEEGIPNFQKESNQSSDPLPEDIKNWLLNYCDGSFPGDFTVGEVVQIIKEYSKLTKELPEDIEQWIENTGSDYYKGLSNGKLSLQTVYRYSGRDFKAGAKSAIEKLVKPLQDRIKELEDENKRILQAIARGEDLAATLNFDGIEKTDYQKLKYENKSLRDMVKSLLDDYPRIKGWDSRTEQIYQSALKILNQ